MINSFLNLFKNQNKDKPVLYRHIVMHRPTQTNRESDNIDYQEWMHMRQMLTHTNENTKENEEHQKYKKPLTHSNLNTSITNKNIYSEKPSYHHIANDFLQTLFNSPLDYQKFITSEFAVQFGDWAQVFTSQAYFTWLMYRIDCKEKSENYSHENDILHEYKQLITHNHAKTQNINKQFQCVKCLHHSLYSSVFTHYHKLITSFINKLENFMEPVSYLHKQRNREKCEGVMEVVALIDRFLVQEHFEVENDKKNEEKNGEWERNYLEREEIFIEEKKKKNEKNQKNKNRPTFTEKLAEQYEKCCGVKYQIVKEKEINEEKDILKVPPVCEDANCPFAAVLDRIVRMYGEISSEITDDQRITHCGCKREQEFDDFENSCDYSHGESGNLSDNFNFGEKDLKKKLRRNDSHVQSEYKQLTEENERLRKELEGLMTESSEFKTRKGQINGKILGDDSENENKVKRQRMEAYFNVLPKEESALYRKYERKFEQESKCGLTSLYFGNYSDGSPNLEEKSNQIETFYYSKTGLSNNFGENRNENDKQKKRDLRYFRIDEKEIREMEEELKNEVYSKEIFIREECYSSSNEEESFENDVRNEPKTEFNVFGSRNGMFGNKSGETMRNNSTVFGSTMADKSMGTIQTGKEATHVAMSSFLFSSTEVKQTEKAAGFDSKAQPSVQFNLPPTIKNNSAEKESEKPTPNSFTQKSSQPNLFDSQKQASSTGDGLNFFKSSGDLTKNEGIYKSGTQNLNAFGNAPNFNSQPRPNIFSSLNAFGSSSDQPKNIFGNSQDKKTSEFMDNKTTTPFNTSEKKPANPFNITGEKTTKPLNTSELKPSLFNFSKNLTENTLNNSESKSVNPLNPSETKPTLFNFSQDKPNIFNTSQDRSTPQNLAKTTPTNPFSLQPPATQQFPLNLTTDTSEKAEPSFDLNAKPPTSNIFGSQNVFTSHKSLFNTKSELLKSPPTESSQTSKEVSQDLSNNIPKIVAQKVQNPDKESTYQPFTTLQSETVKSTEQKVAEQKVSDSDLIIRKRRLTLRPELKAEPEASKNDEKATTPFTPKEEQEVVEQPEKYEEISLSMSTEVELTHSTDGESDVVEINIGKNQEKKGEEK